MTKVESGKTMEDLIYLVTCAVKNTVPDKDRICNMDLDRIYHAAMFHQLTSITAFALESVDIHNPAFTQAKARAIYRSVLMESEIKELSAKLDEKGIWYVPLKGTVLKDYYPMPGMREMADVDILFDAARAEAVRYIMESRGFQTEHFGSGNHDVYYKLPVLNFEMHTALFGPSHEEKLFIYYKDVEEHLKGNGCKRSFTSEDFYIYMLAHAYKHYSGSGTGLRTLLDIYVYLDKNEMDMTYIAEETGKLGVTQFEKSIRSLALHLFNGRNLTDKEQEMLTYIMTSGTYGTINHRIENTLRKTGRSKLQYMLDRFLFPVTNWKQEKKAYLKDYPPICAYRFFLPFLLFLRVARALRSGRFVAEVRAVWKSEV